MKTVIITGASRGIGAAICRALRAKGIRVIGVARNGAALEALSAEKIGLGKMEYVTGDVGDARTAEKALELATKGGSLEGLILNAAVLGPVATLADSPVDEIRSAFDTNVFSVLMWMQKALPALRMTQGRVIVTSSLVTEQSYVGFGTYSASKAAIKMFMSIMAAEEKDKGVTIMSVEPGIVETGLSTEFKETGGAKSFLSNDQRDFIKANMKKPEDVAGAYAKLIMAAPKDKSGAYISWHEPWIAQLPDY